MQEELHKKGRVLTQAWTDLFSFVAKYEAELKVKENAVEVAEKEVDIRREQFEKIKPLIHVGSGNDEIVKLREEIQSKDIQLKKAQSELVVSEQTAKSVSLDLANHVRLLEKLQLECLDKENDLVRLRNEVQSLKSELTVSKEEARVKSHLLQKMESQLMKENTELREQAEANQRAFELEVTQHKLTKGVLQGQSLLIPSASSSASTPWEASDMTAAFKPPLSHDAEEIEDLGLVQNHHKQTSSTQNISSMQNISSPSFVNKNERIMPAILSRTRSNKRKADDSGTAVQLDSSWTPMTQTDNSAVSVKSEPCSDASHDSTDVFFPLTVNPMHCISDIPLQTLDNDTSGNDVLENMDGGSLNNIEGELATKKLKNHVCSGCLERDRQMQTLEVKIHDLEGNMTLTSPYTIARCGVLPRAIAEENKMVELLPGTGVYIYPHLKDTALSRGEKAAKSSSSIPLNRSTAPPRCGLAMARNLMNAFWKSSEIKVATLKEQGPPYKRLDERVVNAVLDFCEKYSGVSRGKVKNAMWSKITAARSKSNKGSKPVKRLL